MNFRFKHNGFTLIEVIMILVVGGILASMVVPYFWSGALTANTPIDRLVVSSTLNKAMETVVCDFNTNADFAIKNAATLTAFAAKVDGSNFSKNYGLSCPDCSATATTVAIGGVDNAILVAITSSTGEKLYHVFTVQN